MTPDPREQLERAIDALDRAPEAVLDAKLREARAEAERLTVDRDVKRQRFDALEASLEIVRSSLEHEAAENARLLDGLTSLIGEMEQFDRADRHWIENWTQRLRALVERPGQEQKNDTRVDSVP